MTQSTPSSEKSSANFDRRKFIIGSAAGILAAGGAKAASASSHGGGHHHGHHDHHGGSDNLKEVAHAALHCQRDGDACLNHCIELFKTGDTSVAACADAVVEMLAICKATSQLAAANSKHLEKVVAACIDICTQCADECKKHADKHPECKACADSCTACIKACKAVA